MGPRGRRQCRAEHCGSGGVEADESVGRDCVWADDGGGGDPEAGVGGGGGGEGEGGEGGVGSGEGGGAVRGGGASGWRSDLVEELESHLHSSASIEVEQLY